MLQQNLVHSGCFGTAARNLCPQAPPLSPPPPPPPPRVLPTGACFSQIRVPRSTLSHTISTPICITVADRNKTETQNRKQNHKMHNRNTKLKTETQNRKQKPKTQNGNPKPKTETQNRKQKPKTQNGNTK